MNSGKYVFTQILHFANRYEFEKCVNNYNGDYRTRELNCWNQFVQLYFGQLTSRNSLRDICTCLKAHKSKLYHLGIKQNALDLIAPIPEAIYLMDKAYIDFAALYNMHNAKARFVTRAKASQNYTIIESNFNIDKRTGLRSDSIITLNGPIYYLSYN